ncbi:MAG: DUF1223 domain-containing protein [Thiobacillus sp.]
MRTLFFACVLAAPAVHAAPCTTTSSATRTSLLELYTSEGCSSCPPADRWLSQLPPDSGVVPLAFHVDYWDKLGWRDPYAQGAFSQRQRARNSGLGWVYTPQVMLNGDDFRNWHRGLPALSKAAPAQVRLTLNLDPSPERIDVQVDSRFTKPDHNQNGQLFLALYENRLSSKVTAGENTSRTLNHDYVVRQLIGPLDPLRARYSFKLQPGWKAADLGVAAFVLDGEGETLQALARSACF